MKAITKFIIYFAIFLSPFFVKGTHIVGGTAAYQVINVENDIATLQMQFYLYRDGNSPAQFDDTISIGLYGYVDEEYQYITKKSVFIANESPIEFEGLENCVADLYTYTLGLYAFQIDIPIGEFEYYTIAYQRCCRDLTISNIISPFLTGIAITLDIYPKAFEFQDKIQPLKTAFPVHSEPGESAHFDLSIEDDFDKKYYLSAPKASGGILGSGGPGDPNGCQGIIPDPANCPPEFADVEYINPEQPYGEGAEINLNEDSGILEVNIPLTNQVLVGITLDRFADNELICRVRQQFIINSYSCLPTYTKDGRTPEFTIWPIPATETIYFNSPLKHVSILDVTGAFQPIRNNYEFATQADISALQSGLYYIMGMTINEEWVLGKLVKVD